MYLSKFTLHNYKAFYETQELSFQPGFNIIVGQNNAGKTALLEALTLNIQPKPHWSEKTVPRLGLVPAHESWASVQLTTSGSELAALMQERDFPSQFHLFEAQGRTHEETLQDLEAWIQHVAQVKISISVGRTVADTTQILPVPYSITSGKMSIGVYRRTSGKGWAFQGLDQKGLKNDGWHSLTSAILSVYKKRVYRFNAERMNVSKCAFGHQMQLKPDASNLPEAISTMYSERPIVREHFNELVSLVFPQIKQVVAQNRQGNELEIMLWTADPKRHDLAISLSECGTGIGQVLAILFVVLTSDSPRTLIIDEPQSFLHPGATRKLIEILKTFPQHQYFISTHSPDIIAATNPQSITLLKFEDDQSIATPMNADDTQQLRQTLDELGVRLSDVFGMEKILWVEGPTEELCFPLILERMRRKSTQGDVTPTGEKDASASWQRSGLATRILAVQHTGDLEGKHAKLVFDLYKRLSGGNSLLPPAVGFIFDREGKTDQQMQDIQRQAGSKVHFLERPMYENYLLHPEAIAAVANGLPGFQKQPLTPERVREWIGENQDTYRMRGPNAKAGVPVSLENLHAANLLTALFDELSEHREEYKKTRDSVALTRWLLENDPSALKEVETLLVEMMAGEG